MGLFFLEYIINSFVFFMIIKGSFILQRGVEKKVKMTDDLCILR